MKSIELGSKVEDTVTGIRGIVIGHTKWLTGCDQYIVQPPGEDKDGARKSTSWIDVQRLLILEPPSATLRAVMTDTEAPNGGDHSHEVPRG